MKKFLIILMVVVLGLAYWLISPLWRTIPMDEPFPETPETLEVNQPDANAPETVQEAKPEQKKAVEQKPVQKKSVEKTIVLSEAPLVASAHDVEGKVLLLQKGEQKIIRFENLKTINGPDLRIYLSTDLKATDTVDLGPIKATEGNVNYVLPAGTDTNKYRSVLIWCRAFSVLFSSAQLSL